ncbi:hypothetical protein GEMRC1_004206 [Eukaryota sp. GEM-RC1]
MAILPIKIGEFVNPKSKSTDVDDDLLYSQQLVTRITSDHLLKLFISSDPQLLMYSLQCIANFIKSKGFLTHFSNADSQVLKVFCHTKFTFTSTTIGSSSSTIMERDPNLSGESFLGKLSELLIEIIGEKSVSEAAEFLKCFRPIITLFPSLTKALFPTICFTFLNFPNSPLNRFSREVNSFLLSKFDSSFDLSAALPSILIVVDSLIYQGCASFTPSRAPGSANINRNCPKAGAYLFAPRSSLSFRVLSEIDFKFMIKSSYKLGYKERAAVYAELYSKYCGNLDPEFISNYSSLLYCSEFASLWGDESDPNDVSQLSDWSVIDNLIGKVGNDSDPLITSIYHDSIALLVSDTVDSTISSLLRVQALADVEVAEKFKMIDNWQTLLDCRRQLSFCPQNLNYFNFLLPVHSKVIPDQRSSILLKSAILSRKHGNPANAFQILNNLNTNERFLRFKISREQAICMHQMAKPMAAVKIFNNLISELQPNPIGGAYFLHSIYTALSHALIESGRDDELILKFEMQYVKTFDEFFNSFISNNPPEMSLQARLVVSDLLYLYCSTLDKQFVTAIDSMNRSTHQSKTTLETGDVYDSPDLASDGENSNPFTAPLDEAPQYESQNILTCLKYWTLIAILGVKNETEALCRALLMFFRYSKYSPSESDAANILISAIDIISPYKWNMLLSQVIGWIDSQSPAVNRVIKTLVVKTLDQCPETASWMIIPLYVKLSEGRQTGFKHELYTILRARQEMKVLAKLHDVMLSFCKNSVKSKNDAGGKTLNLSRAAKAQLDSTFSLLAAPLLSNFLGNSDVLKVHSVSAKIYVFSSNTLPFKCDLKLSNGESRAIIIKPKDDLRIDNRVINLAVFYNDLLRKSSSRDLAVSTHLSLFAALPIAAGCGNSNENFGILEMIPNTKPMREILHDLYQTYEGHQGSESEWFRVMASEHKSKYESWSKRPDFEELMHAWYVQHFASRFPPVFHRWFFQKSKFSTFSEVVEAKRKFGISSALWCGICYVLGLGDRHFQNILLDIETGTCQHCDFNFIFHRGKTTRVPERVPFRLTSNVVDGLGPRGIENVAKPVIGHALHCARKNADFITTLLYIFVKDRLSERKSDQDIELLQRRVRGEIKGIFRPVKVVVEKLVNEATDDRNLCLMWCGWTAQL